MAGNETFDLGLGQSNQRSSVKDRLADIQQGAPLAGEPAKPKTIQDISIETGVPWNVIETVVQDSGVAPEQGLALAQDFAHKMKGQIERGQDIPAAMRSVLGEDAPVEDALKRAVSLVGGDQGRAAPDLNNDNTFAEDAGRAFVGGAVSGVGAIADGVGTLMDVDDLFGNPGVTDWAETAGRAVGDTLRGWGQNVKDGMSDDAKRAIRNSTPKGRLFDPSTWEFEGDVSPQGIALLAGDVLGSLAPVVIAGIFTGPIGAAAVGGAQGAGSGAETGREIVNRASHEQLAEASAYYNELLDKGLSQEDAKAKVADATGSLSAVFAAPVAALGGAITGGIVSKGVGSLAGRGVATRVAGTAGIAAAEEGAQEVMEGVAARKGAEIASGLPVDEMEGTFGEFVLGALGGGVVGAGRGAVPTGAREDEDEAEPQDPLALPAPDSGLPAAPAGDDAAALERPPLGNMARAAQAAPPVAVDATPEPTVDAQQGQSVRVSMRGGQTVDAEYVGEDETGVSLKINGEPVLITPERMAQDGVSIEPVDQLAEASWDGAEATPETNFLPLDDSTEPLPARTQRLQGALDTYLTDQKIEADENDRTEILNSIDRFGGTVEQAVADFQAEMQMEALAAEGREIAPITENERRTNKAETSPTTETPVDLPAAQTKEGGLLTKAPAEAMTQNDGTAWGAMTAEQRTALLLSVGFKDAQGNLNAPGRRAAAKEWDALTDRVREKLGERIEPQAGARAPVAPTADPNRGIGESEMPALEAPAKRPARTQPGVNVLPDGQDPISMPGSVAAAAEDTEQNPTEGQKEAENYKTGKAKWQGLNLSIENKKGTERSKTTPDGKTAWSVTMPAHYGRILRTEGADGDHVDFYMGDNEASESVWVIDQMDAETGRFDEHKVMLGFVSPTEAADTYKSGFSDGKGKERLGGIKKMTADEFKDWLASGDTTKPVTPKATRDDAAKKGDTKSDAPEATTGRNFMLVDRFDTSEQRRIASLRDTIAGDLIGQLDQAARNAADQMRRNGKDPADYDIRGMTRDGKWDQNASIIGRAEDAVRRLLDEAKAAKTGDLPYPERDEASGEFEIDDGAVSNALTALDEFDAMSNPIDTVDESQGDAENVNVERMPEGEIFPPIAKKNTVNLDAKAKQDGLLTLEEAQARVQSWKDRAAEIGRSGVNKGKVVISLFDYTGAWSQPWVDAGYEVVRHDIKTGTDILLDAWVFDRVAEYREAGLEVVGVLSACPCTTFTGSGARWWAERHDVETPEAVEQVFGPTAVMTGAKSPREYNVMLVEATKDMIAAAAPTRFHVLENPVGRIQDVGGMPEPTVRFNPNAFGDPYTKRTQIFGTMETDLPFALVDASDGSKMQSKYRGDDPLGKEMRSTTPEGFSYAFFMANDPAARASLDDAPATEATPDRAESVETRTLPGKHGKVAVDLVKLNVRKWPEGYDVSGSLNVPGFSGSTLRGSYKTFYPTKHEAVAAATANVIRSNILPNERETASSEKQKADGKKIKAFLEEQSKPEAWGEEARAQGKSDLPGGVAKGETRAEDQGAAKIMLRRARVRAGAIQDTGSYNKFMVDGRKPVSEGLAQEAEQYLRDTQAQADEAAKALDEDDAPKKAEAAPKKRPAGKGADMPMSDYSGVEINAYDDNTSDDGRNSDIKNAFKKDAMRWGRALAKQLKEAGFEDAANRGKRIKPVSFNAGGVAVSGDMTVTMAGPDGFGVYVSVGQGAMSGRGGLTVMWRITHNEKPYAGYQNEFADPSIAPRDLADKIAAMHARFARHKEERLAKEAEDAAARPLKQESGKRLTTKEEGRAAGEAWAAQGKPEAMQDDPAMGNASEDARGGWVAGYRKAQKAEDALRNNDADKNTSPEPADQSADDILDAAFDDVFGAEREAVTDVTGTVVEQDPETAWDSATNGEREVAFTASGWTVKGSNSLNEAAKRNVDRDWTDLTQAAKNKVKSAIEGGMLMGDYANAERARRDNPQTPPRTAGEAAQSAASNVAEGVGNIVDGLNALFSDPNKLSAGLTFDAETYAKAKPMFIAAVRAFGQAGQDVVDMAKAMVRGLQANGLTRDAQENMRPYLTQFISDMRDGTIDPFAEDVQNPPESDTTAPEDAETTDEQRGDQEGDQGEPESEEPESALGPVGEPDGGPADDGRGEGDEDGAGEPAGDDAGGSLGDRAGSISDGPVDARTGTPPANFIITDDFALGEGTDGQKLAANMAALRLVDTLEKENRYATEQEQETLARWVGWGGLKTVFDGKHEGTTTQWGRAQAELKDLLTTEEYIAAMRSTNDAHYTSRTVVKAMWRAMRNFGFDGGRALEPTIGSGNFLGLQPADLSEKTEWFAAELDPVTGRIAKHLYPQAQVFDGMGFQDAPFRRAVFDVSIGNPPFGSDQIGNKSLHPDLGKMKVHNFIIAKTGQLLREGGVMSMVVTHRFLDTDNPEARATLAPDFRFLGAVRLPNTAFEENANTQVTTDIVFFQKRREGETDNDTTWLETGAEGPNGTRLNRYFAENPDMILGRAAMDGTMYGGGRGEGGKGEFTVHADGRDIETALNEAVDRIKATIPQREGALEDATTARENSSTLPYGAMMLAKDGRIYRGEEDTDGNRVVQEVTADTFWKDNAEAQGRVVDALRAVVAAKKAGVEMQERLELEQEARNAALDVGLVDLAGDPVSQKTKYETALADSLLNLTAADTPRKDALAALDAYAKVVDGKRLGTDGFKRLSAVLDLRQRTRELIALERADAMADKIEARRRGLRNAYRRFQRSYGYINAAKNEAILRGDVGPEFALEIGYKAPNAKEGREEAAKEAPILSKRVIYPHKLPDNVESVADGLHVSMQERGHIDPALIATLTGKSVEDVVQEMVSGAEPLAFRNPKTGNFEIAEVYLSGNLAEKIAAAKEGGAYENIPHLKNAMPPPKTQDQIIPSIRSLWIPPHVYQDFLSAMGYAKPKVALLEGVGMASVQAGSAPALTEFGQQFSTERMGPAEVFDHAIKGKIPVVYDTIRVDNSTKRIKNEAATREAIVAYEQMSKEFPEWAYANPQRAGQIVDAFNEKMNVVTERTYQGVRYLRMVGNSPEIDLRNSQKNGAWRMIQDKVSLMHHVVGAGKTFTAIAGVMERKRMGLTRKAVIAVPNHLTGQWGREWLELYPAANILVPTERDFQPANRAKLINRIATGDFDAVIVGHSQLTKIANDAEIEDEYISAQIEELNAALQEAKRSGESKRTVGQIGTRLTTLKTKLKGLKEKLAEKSDDKVLGWQDLGVDYMVVDEAHLFKNLEYTTTATQLVGMNPPGGSQRAFDMLMKVRSLQGMQNGGVSFLTGTPVSNSLVEIYSMMKYLIPESLESMNIHSFDAWKAAFIQDQSRIEYTASMQLKERNVMSGMINLGPLAQLYRSFADIVMRPDVERMFTEQMEARNAKQTDPAKIVPTRFPTPKIKGGARRISLAPPTEKMKEFVRYLVMRMAGIKQNKSNKEYMKVDNSLWVLTDARKASVDIRTIDPTLGREEGSKVDRASAEIFRIWEANAERRGAQMVFSDMSAPTKTASKDANRILKKAYEKLGLKGATLKARTQAEDGMSYAERWGNVIEDIENLISDPDTDEKKRDSLVEFSETEEVQDASSAMFTADTGFSFYDDLKAALIEKGVPEDEIAFIHDYNTTKAKADLFEAVNDGRIRVLLGSTQKMGAGTNAQKRLVALHHIDAPWRPSDMEQREGRIIRQGNLFYADDPEGFEVEIIAYSTEQTADVVQWQVLERKAASIETFLNAATDSIEEEGGDADQYAEFMAQSTGKEVFLQKMQAEKDRDTARAKIASTLRNLSEADRFIAGFDRNQHYLGLRADTFAKLSIDDLGDGADTYLSGWEAEAAQYRAEKARIEAEREEVRARNADKPRKEWEKLPALPESPKRWEEPPASGWERKVYDALSRTTNNNQPVQIPLGAGFSLLVQGHAEGGGVTSYTTYLTPPNNDEIHAEMRLVDGWGSIEAKDFRRSDKLLNALSPANIMSRAEDRARRYANEKARHAELLPEMKDIKAKGVDMEPVNAAEERLARLSALVRIEEVKFATETSSAGPNYFALRDDKGRDLVADDTAKPLTGQFQFTNAGQNYASEWGAPDGTRRIEGTDKTGNVAIFEAENMDTGEAVIIEAIQTKAAEGEASSGEWDVLNVWDAPAPDVTDVTPDAKDADEMRTDDDGNPNIRASLAAPQARRADLDAAAGDAITSAPEARKAMRKVRKALRDELAAVGIGARITLDVRDGVIDNFPGIAAMDGYFLDGVIGIAADTPGGYMGVLRHEIIHALRNAQLWGKDHGLFTANEWRALVRAARSNTRLMDQVKRDYPDLSETAQIEEVVAEMFREWSETKDTSTAFGKAMDKLRQIIDAISTALRGQGLNDAAAVFEKIRSGEVGGRGPDGPGSRSRDNRSQVQAKVAAPRDVAQIKAKARGLRAGISQLASDAVTNAMKDRNGYNTLGFVPGRALFKELGKGISAAQRYLTLKEKMDTKRNDKHAETDVVAQKWRKLTNQNPDANAEMMKLMHDSTIAGVDPSEAFSSPMSPRDPDIIKAGRVANPIAYEAAMARKEQHDKLKAAHDDLSPRFDQLPQSFQKLYREVRDTYAKLDDEMTAAIIGNVERAMTLAVRRAEREHKKAVETARSNYAGSLGRIGNDGSLSGTQKATQRAQAKMKLDDAIKEADEALATARATRAWSKDNRVRSLRAQFETDRLSGPYFPLARFGEFFVLARDGEGNVQSFSRHETVQEQREAQKDMEAEGFDVTVGVMQDTDARDLVDPAFVSDIERMLEEVNADEKLMDDIWQRWLQTLPDMSIRKHNIHRKNREGYDADAMRAFGSHMFHGSHQLARLLYSLEMQEELDVASEEAAASEDPVRNGFIVNEMKRRHAFTMNPKGAWWASRATSLAFIYYLSVSPAAAIVNLSQTSIVGTSVLGKFGGTKKAAGALSKALADFTRSPKWHAEDNTKHLSADERAAMHEAYKRGVIDRTQSHDLAQVAESGVEYNAKWVNVMDKVSWLFHHSERMNREVTFLAGYRLLREQGRQHEAAITEAGNATWEVHFDYQNTSKPRVMQSPGMQVLLTFRNFTVNFLWRIFRDLHQSINGKDAETRKEAKRQAVTMAAMMLFHAGIKGVYGYGIIMALAGMFFGDDEDDPEERVEKILFDYLPRPVAKVMLDGVPGTLAGIDLTARIGMPNLWFRGSLRPLEGADLYQHYVNEVLGPIPAIGMNLATGASRVIDGAEMQDGSLIYRGVETAMPKFFRDAMKGGRYAYEGALTYNGDPIKDDFSAWEIIAQVSGFTPKELANQYDQNGRLKNKERAITDRRRNVIKQAAEQIKDGDPLTARQMRLIEEFNRDYPEWPITPDTIQKSARGRVQRSQRNEAGVQVNPRLEPRLRGSLSPLVAGE